MTTATSLAPFEIGRAAMDMARKATIAFNEDIPDDKFLHRPVPSGNHAAWILGHIAYADSMIAAQVGDIPQSAPDGFNELFGMGSTPSDDASIYPSVAELRAALEPTRESMIAWFKGMDDAQLAAPLPEGWEGFAPTHAALMGICAWHEGLHGGQLTVIRKSLGLPVKFG